MADNEDKNFPDEFSPENTNESTSEFNPDENPYEDFLSGVDAASVKAKDEIDESVKKAFHDGPKASENATHLESSSNPEKDFTTEKDIDIPDFLKGDSGVEDDFQGSVKNNDSSSDVPDEFNPSPSSDENNVSEYFSGSSEQETESFGSGSTEEEDDAPEVQDEEDTPSGGNTEDADKETESFSEKISAAEADTNNHKGAKPKVLNKKFLLTAIVIIIGLIFLITFLLPSKGEKKDNDKGKPVATTHQGTDYASLANRQYEEGTGDGNHYKDINANGDGNNTGNGNGYGSGKNNNEEVEIPPVIVKNEKQPYSPNSINYNTGNGGGAGSSGSTSSIPDTRNDSLQGKSISGIKGLTPSQNSYQTDYQQTVAKNTASTRGTSGNTLPSKEEFMNSYLDSYTKAYGSTASSNNAYAVQNDQAGKNSFYNNGRNAANVGQGEYLNLNTLWQGSIFEAVLTSELNTDLPGEITARISKNIYSSQDGRYLLIPQNSVLYGSYNSSISYSQSRVQVAWHTLVRPDGYQVQLGAMNATDAKGASGLKGFVNDHPLAYLKAIGLMSVFSIVNSEFQNSMGNTSNEYVQNILANSQEVVTELGDKLIDRAMNVQPTIKIKAGTKINIVVNQNLSLPPCEDIPVTQAYRRY